MIRSEAYHRGFPTVGWWDLGMGVLWKPSLMGGQRPGWPGALPRPGKSWPSSWQAPASLQDGGVCGGMSGRGICPGPDGRKKRLCLFSERPLQAGHM